jgi:hypothetical protein
MQDETLTKVCTKCGEAKELTAFHKDRSGRFGVTTRCKACTKLADAEKFARAAHGVADRVGCKNPTACKAKGASTCPPCTRAKLFADPHYVAKMNNARNAVMATEEYKIAASKRMAALYGDPEFAEANRRRSSERLTRLNENPEFRKKSSDRFKALHADDRFSEGLKERAALQMKALWEDVDFRKSVVERTREMNADTDFQKRRIAAVKIYHQNRRENEEFDAFMERMEAEAAEWEAANQTTTEEGDLNGTSDPR